jgi:uncharacterized membrane protein YdbT with pleckstrin-like domain
MRSEPYPATTLHPVSLLIGVPLIQLVRALVVPAFAVLASGRTSDRTPLLVLVLLTVGAVVRVLAWQRFRWSFDGEVVRVDQGVLSRTRRVVAIDRIQQVELDRPLIQRLLGVATLRIETAGSDAGPEIELRVLRLDEAVALRAALQPRNADRHRTGRGVACCRAPSGSCRAAARAAPATRRPRIGHWRAAPARARAAARCAAVRR